MKMGTSEYKCFIQILSDFLNGRKTERYVSDRIDWNIILKYAKMHQVEGIVYYQCKSYLNDKARSSLEKIFGATVFYYKNRERMAATVKQAFADNNVPCVEVKGMEVAKYYPIPAMRTMGDLDIVIHEEDKEKAEQILSDLGIVFKFEYTGKERGYIGNRIVMELHHNLIYDEIVTLPEQKKFFNDCWDYVSKGELDHSFHFLFLIAHLRKHFLNEGVGIRQFMDIAAVARNDSTLNWPWIEEKLRELQLHRFAQTCFAMTEYWFGIKIPMYYPRAEEEFAEQTTERILSNGVFGFQNINNRRNSVINQMQEYRGPIWMFRLKLTFERLFPSYESLRVGALYKFLDGRPWLLPVAWIRRIYYMALGKTTDGKDIMDRIMTPDDMIEMRKSELRQWGLLD